MSRLLVILSVGVLALAACGGDTSTASPRAVDVKITAEGCSPAELQIDAGATTFNVENVGTNAVSEFEILGASDVVGEQEGLAPGDKASFTVDLQPGTYTLFCPGTATPKGTLRVAGADGSVPPASGDAAGEADGCAPSDSATQPTSRLVATLTDYHITLGSPAAPAGVLALDGTNDGTHPHEVVIVKDVAPGDLPTDPTGSVDEDKLPQGALIGELEAFSPGRQCSASFALEPGNYTLFCNVVGAEEGAHVQLGMVTSMTVTP